MAMSWGWENWIDETIISINWDQLIDWEESILIIWKQSISISPKQTVLSQHQSLAIIAIKWLANNWFVDNAMESRLIDMYLIN